MPNDFVDSTWMADPAAGLPPPEVIFGTTQAMEELREKVSKVADTEVPVLLQGESGTGKEVIAKFMHSHSVWRSGPFVKVHCPAIPESLLESELFGYEEGAFTGADAPKVGRLEAADCGTLLLDEIAELSSGSQAKLLQVLQDGQVFRIGAQEGKPIQVRVICATHRPVGQEIRNGSFRPDLFYRISVVTLRVPPLRERREDIPGLAEYFLQFYSKKYGRAIQPLSRYCLQLLQEGTWAGNIRELENLINRYVILESEQIVIEELIGGQAEPAEVGDGKGPVVSLRRVARLAGRAAERRVILQALHVNQGNRKKTARLLNISYRSLLYKIKEAGIPRKGSQEQPSTELPAGSDLNGERT